MYNIVIEKVKKVFLRFIYLDTGDPIEHFLSEFSNLSNLKRFLINFFPLYEYDFKYIYNMYNLKPYIICYNILRVNLQ